MSMLTILFDFSLPYGNMSMLIYENCLASPNSGTTALLAPF